MDALGRCCTLLTKISPEVICFSRSFSNAASSLKISENIRLYRGAKSETKRPLAVILGWLFAKQKYLNKYGEFYLNQGFDVVTVQIGIKQVFLPSQAQKLAGQVLDVISGQGTTCGGVLTHTFSVGGYIYGEMLVRLLQNNKYDPVVKQMRGTIYDSPVDYNGIANGVSKAITENKVARSVIESSIEFVMGLRMSAKKDYLRASEEFHKNRLRLPGVFLYSLMDPVAEPDKYERIAKSWREAGIHVKSRHWKDAKHVSVYSKYPIEYTDVISDFIMTIDIKSKKESTINEPPRKTVAAD